MRQVVGNLSVRAARQAKKRAEGGFFKGALALSLRLCGILERGNGESR